MENINREYVARVHNYIVAMVCFEELLNKGEITIEEYIEIERKIAFKYKLEESIFRMEIELAIMKKQSNKLKLILKSIILTSTLALKVLASLSLLL